MLIPEAITSVKERARLTLLCQRDLAIRELVIQRCAEDPAFFLSFAGWTFDPREDQPDQPFLLYPYQVELLRWLEERLRLGEDGVIDKSRDMGVSWVVVGWLLHHWLFHPGFQALIGSRTEAQVDNRVIDSHFGRLEYLIRHLPPWLVPEGFKWNKHRFHMKLVNPANGAVIKGESSQGNFGRAGRFNVAFIDEFAFWDPGKQLAAWASLSGATKTRLAVSTPNGMDNLFAELVHSGKIPHLRLHWSLHPKKDEAWYAKQVQRLTSRELLQEVEISYRADESELVYPSWASVPKEPLSYQPGWTVYCSWDFGLDTTCVIWWQRDPATGRIHCLDAVQRKGVTVDWFVPFVTGEVPRDWPHHYTEAELDKIAAHREWSTPIHFGDPAGKNRHVGTGLSVLDVLKAHGIYVYTNQKARDYLTRKQMTEIGLRDVVCNVNPGNPVDAAIVDEAMSQARKDDQGKPVHDGTSHLRSAVEYFFVNLPPFRRVAQPEPVIRRMAYDQVGSRRR